MLASDGLRNMARERWLAGWCLRNMNNHVLGPKYIMDFVRFAPNYMTKRRPSRVICAHICTHRLWRFEMHVFCLKLSHRPYHDFEFSLWENSRWFRWIYSMDVAKTRRGNLRVTYLRGLTNLHA